MKHPILSVFFFILPAVLALTGCQTRGKANPDRPPIYECKNYELLAPIITVDAETMGKKYGETHFPAYLTDDEIDYTYFYFKSSEEALNALNKDHPRLWRNIRSGEIKNDQGQIIGGKKLFSTTTDYQLIWTKNEKINAVSSASLTAVEEIEKACNL